MNEGQSMIPKTPTLLSPGRKSGLPALRIVLRNSGKRGLRRGRDQGWGLSEKDHAQTKELERDDDSKKNHPALMILD
jgi:hypothetical protein